MTIAALVARYGVLAVFLGSGIEGEAVVVTGGILARKGFFSLPEAMLASACGSCLVDQLWFFLGRYARDWAWVQSLTARRGFAHAIRLLERYPIAFVFGFRFVYGLRTVSPIAIGTTRLPVRLFTPLNALAAAIWGPLFTYVGYQFGKAIDPLLHHLQKGGLIALAAILVGGGIVALVLRRRRQDG